MAVIVHIVSMPCPTWGFYFVHTIEAHHYDRLQWHIEQLAHNISGQDPRKLLDSQHQSIWNNKLSIHAITPTDKLLLASTIKQTPA